MGLHICLYKNGEDHPDWDYLRRGNDRNFPHLIDWDKTTYQKVHKYPEEDENYWRPTDLIELRQRIISTGWGDIDRYLHLVNLIENDPEVYLYFSY